MSDPLGLALIIVALPLAAAVLAFLFNGSDALKRLAHWPLVVACGTAAVLALVLLTKVAGYEALQFVSEPVTWFAAGKLNVNFTITVDPLACVMLAMITFISTFIAVFASGYMRDGHHQPDAGYARFFGVMSLFVFAMCLLVSANNMFLLVAGWEGVGVC